MTITHPHHPLCGQQVALIRVRQGKDPDLIVRLPDGTHAAVAMSLTDHNGCPNSAVPAPAPLSLLHLEGLRQATELIAQLRQTGRFPAAKA